MNVVIFVRNSILTLSCIIVSTEQTLKYLAKGASEHVAIESTHLDTIFKLTHFFPS